MQFLIMIFPSLEGEDDVGYTNKVADLWKVKGDKALMLFVFNSDHKIAIRTGYSLEGDVTDAISSRVIRETMAPYFRAEPVLRGSRCGGQRARKEHQSQLLAAKPKPALVENAAR